MKWIIDRFEGDFAVIGCGDMYFDVPKNTLPEGVSEGDILELKINEEETRNTTEQMQKRLNKIFGD